MVQLSREAFEEAVGAGLDMVPPQLLERLDNIAILVQDEPTPEQGESLLGLYEGIPLTERMDSYGYGALPDRITLFQGPLQRMCRDEDELREQIAVTVVHELGHYFGIDDNRLHELGWG